MSAKTVLVLCAQALLIQSAFSQCTSRAAVDASGIGGFGWGGIGAGFAYDGLAGPYGYDRFTGYGFDGPCGYDGIAGGIGPFGYDGLAGYGAIGLGYDRLYPTIASALEITPTTGGGLIVTSASPIPPVGISVVSENAYEGILAVGGEVPFVGTTGMEGVLPTAGSGAVNHACGNGINAMVSDMTAYAPGYLGAAVAPTAFGSGIGYGAGCGLGYGYGAGRLGYGYGAGLVY